MAKPVAGFNANPQNINRNGRPPKEWTMSELYKQAGEESAETGEPRKKIVARKLWEKAEEGDVSAIKELNNRIDGMAVQKVEGNVNVTTNFVALPTEHNLETPSETD